MRVGSGELTADECLEALERIVQAVGLCAADSARARPHTAARRVRSGPVPELNALSSALLLSQAVLTKTYHRQARRPDGTARPHTCTVLL